MSLLPPRKKPDSPFAVAGPKYAPPKFVEYRAPKPTHRPVLDAPNCKIKSPYDGSLEEGK